jgi:hypothetical protein
MNGLGLLYWLTPGGGGLTEDSRQTYIAFVPVSEESWDGWLRTPYLSLRRAGMAGWTAGGWLAEDPVPVSEESWDGWLDCWWLAG